MEITVQSRADRHELQLQGRLDANWSDRVGQAIETAIRAGHHQLDLDFAQVDYISSAGIRVLLKYYKQLKAARGTLRVLRPTTAVLDVLQLSGIAGLLVPVAAPAAAPATAQPTAASGPAAAPHWERAGVEFESYDLAPGSVLAGGCLGPVEAFATGQLAAAQSQRVGCTPDVLAVGLGAFGGGPTDTQARFGESFAVAGTAVTLPTDESNVPDYQLTEGQLVPELHLLYGLTARGNFSRLLRFEAGRSQRGVVSLADLVESVLENLQTGAAGFAILAECAGVVGATLQRSPAVAAGQSPLTFPGVRDWLTFTTERTDERTVILIVGVADRSPEPAAAAYLRPVGSGTGAVGHFHAAVFPYRPLPKGRLELAEAVAQQLGTESAQTVLHLLADEREFEGLGQTDLMRGACWVGPWRPTGRLPQT